MTGPLPAWLRPVTMPAAWLYGRAIARRNRRYDRGIGVERVGVPVISVGNLTAGGTGKTPVVQWIARRLVASGRRPAIALRGYAAGAAADRAESDEATEHAEAVPGARVLADPDRVAAIRAALREPERGGGGLDVVVLDDGFQHRRLARDLDVVLLDARAGTLEDHLLPDGWLREPLAGLARAGAILVTHAAAVDPALADRVAAIAGRAPIAWTRHAWSGIRVWPGVADGAGVADGTGVPGGAALDAVPEEHPTTWLAGRRIAVMAGIARPAGVASMATAAGADLVHVEAVRDHHRHDASGWAAADGRARAAGAEALLVTRKDRVKLARLPGPPDRLPVIEPRLELAFIDGEAAMGGLVDAVARGAAGGERPADPVVPVADVGAAAPAGRDGTRPRRD